MINIQANTCDDAWQQAAKLVRDNGLAQESRTFRSNVTTDTLELLHASMTIENPRDRLVFSRPINPAFAIAEVIWILAGSNDLQFVRFWNETMKNFSDNGKTLHGAYGYRLGTNGEGQFDVLSVPDNAYFMSSHLQMNQLMCAYDALKYTPHSRQVVLQVWDSRTDLPVNQGLPRSKDVPCNVVGHLLVRDGKLHWLQFMRSNDLMWGTPYNFIQWTSLQEIMAGWLGLEVGQYTHVVSSLHVYENHWEELRNLQFDNGGISIKQTMLCNNPVNESDLRVAYDEWLRIFKIVLHCAIELMDVSKARQVYTLIDDVRKSNVPAAYAEWVYVLGAEMCRKLGYYDDAHHFIKSAGYYRKSWQQWFERKRLETGKSE